MKLFIQLVAMMVAFMIGTQFLRGAEAQPRATTNTVTKPVEIAGVHNAFRVRARIYSGSQPEGDAAFAALAKLGGEVHRGPKAGEEYPAMPHSSSQ